MPKQKQHTTKTTVQKISLTVGGV